jgi:hypothetical protein
MIFLSNNFYNLSLALIHIHTLMSLGRFQLFLIRFIYSKDRNLEEPFSTISGIIKEFHFIIPDTYKENFVICYDTDQSFSPFN